LAEQCLAHELLLLFFGAVLDQRGHQHTRSLPDHLPRRLGAAKLFADDGRFERIVRLLAAAATFRDVAVEIAALDGLQTKGGGALVGAQYGSDHGGLSTWFRTGAAIRVGPVLV